MQPIRQVDILKISPYVRYVNEVEFRGPHEVTERVLFDHELIYCLSGEARMLYDGVMHHIGRGQMFYLRPDILNTMIVDEGCRFHAHCVHFDWMMPDERENFTIERTYFRLHELKNDRELMERLTTRTDYEVPEAAMRTLSSGAGYEVLAPLMRQLYHAWRRSDAGSRLKTRALFLQVVSELLAENVGEQGVRQEHMHHRTISLAVQHLREHFADPVGTPELAARFGLTPKYFGKLFQQTTGMPVQRFLLDIRMQEARRRLIHGEQPIEEVALACGIGDASYFTKLFRRQEGMTPGRYRRMLSGQ